MNKPHVLIVDDSITVLGMLGGIMRDIGFEVYQANNGEEALALLQNPKNKLDLAVVDLNMGEINGLDLGRLILGMEDYGELPVVMMSMDYNEELVKESRAAGMVGCFGKDLIKDARFKACAAEYFEMYSQVSQPRMLVVDDSATTNEMLVKLGKKQGYHVISAFGSAEARTLMRNTEGAFDLYIIDYGLDDENGLDLGKWIKNENGYVAMTMFLVSGEHKMSVVGEYRACGFKQYFTKSKSGISLLDFEMQRIFRNLSVECGRSAKEIWEAA